MTKEYWANIQYFLLNERGYAFFTDGNDSCLIEKKENGEYALFVLEPLRRVLEETINGPLEKIGELLVEEETE